jgi:hypothetical protein
VKVKAWKLVFAVLAVLVLAFMSLPVEIAIGLDTSTLIAVTTPLSDG